MAGEKSLGLHFGLHLIKSCGCSVHLHSADPAHRWQIVCSLPQWHVMSKEVWQQGCAYTENHMIAAQASSEALQNAREALKSARAESAQRLASVQALQAQVARASAEVTVPAAELAAERAARETAERNLAQARTALMHRGQLIDELRKRVRHFVCKSAHDDLWTRVAAPCLSAHHFLASEASLQS